MPRVDEKMFFFKGSKERSLLGFFHQPLTQSPSTAVIYCHPFAEEKNMSHAVAVRTARALAENGIPVFRFDLSGCGDSEGDLTEISLEDWREDLASVVRLLKDEFYMERYALWGLRTGASLALLHAGHHRDVSFIILWQPAVDLKSFMDQFLRARIGSQIANGGERVQPVSLSVRQLEQQGVVEVMGYPISKMLYDSFVDVADRPFHFAPYCTTVLLSISLMDHPSVSMTRYHDLLKLKAAPIELSHIVVEPFWDRYWRWECPEAEEATVLWAANHLNGGDPGGKSDPVLV